MTLYIIKVINDGKKYVLSADTLRAQGLDAVIFKHKIFWFKKFSKKSETFI